MALANAGCEVEAVCPSGHPLSRTSAVHQTHAYSGLAPLGSFAAAIAAAEPDIIVPGDDLATWHLQSLYRQEQSSRQKGKIRTLIERSLGAAENFSVLSSRNEFMALAHAEGIRAPQAEVIQDVEHLKAWTTQTGFPTVLKANGTSGGDGVRIVRTMKDAETAFHALQAAPLLARAAKRALVDQDKTLIWPSLLRRRSVVSAQTFVAGHEATSTICCWQGKALASLHFEVVQKASSAGHATVVRLIENAEMAAAAEKIIRKLRLSGFYGFDFMIEAGTGDAYLIEVNPRATQVGHLRLGPGHDLPAALHAALCGKAAQPAPKVTEKATIALFPQEWIRDSGSEFLRSAYHDVPWDEPELMRECVNSRRKQSAWYSRSAGNAATVQLPEPAAVPPKTDAVEQAWGRKSFKPAILESNTNR
jgi:formate-dependent phosphoribosylglycinamide formyltransferase (GAR transformylase)